YLLCLTDPRRENCFHERFFGCALWDKKRLSLRRSPSEASRSSRFKARAASRIGRNMASTPSAPVNDPSWKKYSAASTAKFPERHHSRNPPLIGKRKRTSEAVCSNS